MQGRVLGLAAVVALAATVVGCGGSSALSKAQYEQRIQADGKLVQEAVRQINLKPGSLKQLAAQVSAAEASAKKAADDLDAVKAPKDVAADNDTLVVALRVIDTQLKKLARAAKDGNQVAAQQAAAAIQTSLEIRAGQAATNDMKKKGYKIGVMGQ